MNAAYLLRFSAPGTAGSREALLHLALPDGGEPPAVRAWAAALAQPLPGEAHASGSSLGSLGSLGSAGSSPAASPSWQEQQARAAGAAAAALLHQRTPRQVLAETAAAQDARSQHGQPLPIAPSPQLPWQASVNLSAAAAAPPPASFDALPGSPSLAPSVPLWLQPQQPLSPTSAHRVGSPLAAPAQHSPASFSPRLLSPPSAHPAHALLAHSPPLAPLQPLPPPLQPLVLEPAALGSFAAQQLQQQPQVPPLLQQQREQEELGPLHALLQQAAQAALVPAKQQQLVAALGGPLAPRLTAPLAAAVGAAGGAPGRLQPHHMHGLVEQNCPVASQVCVCPLASLNPSPRASNLQPAPARCPPAADALAPVPLRGMSIQPGCTHAHHAPTLCCPRAASCLPESPCWLQLLLALLTHHPEAAAVFSAAVAEVPMSAQSVECLSAVVSSPPRALPSPAASPHVCSNGGQAASLMCVLFRGPPRSPCWAVQAAPRHSACMPACVTATPPLPSSCRARRSQAAARCPAGCWPPFWPTACRTSPPVSTPGGRAATSSCCARASLWCFSGSRTRWPRVCLSSCPSASRWASLPRAGARAGGGGVPAEWRCACCALGAPVASGGRPVVPVACAHGSPPAAGIYPASSAASPCLQQSRHKQAADLYRQLRGLEAAAG